MATAPNVFQQAADEVNGSVFHQAAADIQAGKPPEPDTDSDWMKALKGEDTNVMLDSHAAATKQGVLNVIQGVSQGVQGLYKGVKGIASMMETPGVNPAGDLTAGSAGQAVQNTQDVGQAVQSGAAQAAQVPGAVKDINQSADPLGTYAQVAAKTAGQAGGQALVAAGTEGLGRAVPKVMQQGAKAVTAVKDLKDVPAALSEDARSTLATAAHNEGLPPLTSATAREATDELQKSFVAKAKEYYAPVDKAVNGNLKPVQERIAQLKQAYENNKNVNPELADNQLEQLGQQYKTLGQLVEKAKAAGVANAEELMAQGDTYYRKGMAMKEVSKRVKTVSGVAKMGGNPNPVLFANQIDALYNQGTLTRALGEDGAKAMLDTAKEGLRKFRAQNAVKEIPGVKQVVKTGTGLKALAGKTD